MEAYIVNCLRENGISLQDVDQLHYEILQEADDGVEKPLYLAATGKEGLRKKDAIGEMMRIAGQTKYNVFLNLHIELVNRSIPYVIPIAQA